jgi:hypothetical protein
LTVETLSGGPAQLSWDAGLGSGRLETHVVDDELLSAVWGPAVHRLIIAAGTGRPAFQLTLTRGSHL